MAQQAGLIGKKLKGRYLIYDRLGMGGAATVYLSRDIESGQMVIVKVVHSHLVSDQFMGRFQREIDLLQSLDNPHIIRLYDWGLRQFEPEVGYTVSYIVAEFIEGHTLADIIDTRGAFDEANALAIARQIAVGLADIHKQGIVHRDVKSQNIMLTPSEEVKLIDFGIAKGEQHQTLTQSSHFAGTLYYAPPEQILESHTVDLRADIYALGVVLYEMLTATLPIKSREMGTVASKIISGDLDPITGVSPEVEALVNHMLATRVQERIGSDEEVIRRIDAITGGAKKPELDEPLPATGTLSLTELEQHLAAREEGPKCSLLTADGRVLPVKLPETVIGRSHPRHASVPDIDLWGLGLEEARTVSRRHCRIFARDGEYYLEDLGSMNGTYFNDGRLEPNVPVHLEDGDRVAAGRVQLVFKRENH